MAESLSLLRGCLWNIRENLTRNILVEALTGFCFGGSLAIASEAFLHKVHNTTRLKPERPPAFSTKPENPKEGGYQRDSMSIVEARA